MRPIVIVIALLFAMAGCKSCRDRSVPSAPPTPKTEAPPPSAGAQLEAEESEIEPPHIALSIHLAKSDELHAEPPVYLLHRQRDLALALGKR